MENIYDIQEIMNFLPHRYPFLLVDRILEIVPNEKIVALKNVTINEPFFQGHFPGAQAGGALFSASKPKERQGAIFYFMGMDSVRFRKPVVPGDQLIIEMQVLKMRSKVVKMSGIASVDKKRVAEAEIMATIGEKP
jgi:beta-hydroxyacyl-ACP dehydratase FabZ